MTFCKTTRHLEEYTVFEEEQTKMSLSEICLIFSHDWIQFLHLGTDCHRNDIVSFSVNHIRRHRLLVCSIIGEVHFIHLIKVAFFFRFLHCEAAIFPFVVNK